MIIGCDYAAATTAGNNMDQATSEYATFKTGYESVKSNIPNYWKGKEADSCLTTLEDAQTDVTKLGELIDQMGEWIKTLQKNFDKNETEGQSYYSSMRG